MAPGAAYELLLNRKDNQLLNQLLIIAGFRFGFEGHAVLLATKPKFHLRFQAIVGQNIHLK